MRKTYIYNANLKLIYLYFYFLKVREIKRISNFDILTLARINIL